MRTIGENIDKTAFTSALVKKKKDSMYVCMYVCMYVKLSS